MHAAALFANPLPLPTPEQAAWTTLVLRFNLHPAAYADASWLPGWAAGAAEPALRELSLALLRKHGLQADFDWWLNDSAARLFLLDRPTRAQLTLAAGIAAHRDSLRQVVRQADLAALRAALGEALDTLWLPAAEAVERAGEPLHLQRDPFDGAALRRRLEGDGYRQLLRLLDPHDRSQRPAALRAAFCAPQALSRDPLPRLPPPQAERWLDTLVNDLIPRWAPAWTWLF